MLYALGKSWGLSSGGNSLICHYLGSKVMNNFNSDLLNTRVKKSLGERLQTYQEEQDWQESNRQKRTDIHNPALCQVCESEEVWARGFLVKVVLGTFPGRRFGYNRTCGTQRTVGPHRTVPLWSWLSGNSNWWQGFLQVALPWYWYYDVWCFPSATRT